MLAAASLLSLEVPAAPSSRFNMRKRTPVTSDATGVVAAGVLPPSYPAPGCGGAALPFPCCGGTYVTVPMTLELSPAAGPIVTTEPLGNLGKSTTLPVGTLAGAATARVSGRGLLDAPLTIARLSANILSAKGPGPGLPQLVSADAAPRPGSHLHLLLFFPGLPPAVRPRRSLMGCFRRTGGCLR